MSEKKKLNASEAFNLEISLLEALKEELTLIKDELKFLNEAINGRSAEDNNSLKNGNA